MNTVFLKFPRASNGDIRAALTWAMLFVSIALAACLRSFPAPAPTITAPFELLGDNDAGPPDPPPDDHDLSPTLPLPPPRHAVASR